MADSHRLRDRIKRKVPPFKQLWDLELELDHAKGRLARLEAALESVRSRLDSLERLRTVHDLAANRLDVAALRAGGLQGARFGRRSEICRADHFLNPSFEHWCRSLRKPHRLHRKLWEWVWICEALHSQGALQAGKRGLGFAVGREPLAALFASLGCAVTASDADPGEASDAGWDATGQLARGVDDLNELGICALEDFARRVEFRVIDMRRIPSDVRGYDFCWSACALEHLGTLEHGMQFVLDSMECVVPGGLAVHTTEFNVFSDQRTVEAHPGTVVFRRRDLVELGERLRSLGHEMAPLDLALGTSDADRYVDLGPEFSGAGEGQPPHLRLLLGGFVCTSVALFVRRGR